MTIARTLVAYAVAVGVIVAAVIGTAWTVHADDTGPGTRRPVTVDQVPWREARAAGWQPDNPDGRTDTAVYSRNKPRRPWCSRQRGFHDADATIVLDDGRTVKVAGLCMLGHTRLPDPPQYPTVTVCEAGDRCRRD